MKTRESTIAKETRADRAMREAREEGELAYRAYVATLDPRERERLVPDERGGQF